MSLSFSRSTNGHVWCDRSAKDVHSFMAPDHTSNLIKGPCLLCFCFEFFLWACDFDYLSLSPHCSEWLCKEWIYLLGTDKRIVEGWVGGENNWTMIKVIGLLNWNESIVIIINESKIKVLIVYQSINRSKIKAFKNQSNNIEYDTRCLCIEWFFITINELFLPS